MPFFHVPVRVTENLSSTWATVPHFRVHVSLSLLLDLPERLCRTNFSNYRAQVKKQRYRLTAVDHIRTFLRFNSRQLNSYSGSHQSWYPRRFYDSGGSPAALLPPVLRKRRGKQKLIAKCNGLQITVRFFHARGYFFPWESK